MNKKENTSPRTVIYNHIQTDERNKDYFLYITTTEMHKKNKKYAQTVDVSDRERI